MDAITEVPQESYINPLESFLPEKVVEELSLKKDCTDDILKIIKTTTSNNLKKLAEIICKLDNYDLERIVEITVSKTRLSRFNATFSIFSYIKHYFENVKKAAEIEGLYESVFTSRFRDIDPAIRCMCIQFLTEWILVSNALRDMKYLKYLGWALNDRSDSVRRKAVRSMFKLSKLLKQRSKAIVELYEKYKNRLVEMSLRDINKNIQKDASRLIMAVFLKNDAIFNNDEVVQVLAADNESTESKVLIMKKLCPDGIWDFDTIHEYLDQSKSNIDRDSLASNIDNCETIIPNAHIFKNLINTETDVTSFILNIIEFVKNNSACCSRDFLCFLSILPYLDMPIDPSIFINLLETVKDNQKNIDFVLTALAKVNSYPEYTTSTYKLIEYLMNLVADNDVHIERLVILLKKLENNFSIQVADCIAKLSEKYSGILIKYFNIPISNSHEDILAICYGVLWNLMDENYEWIENIVLRQRIDVENSTIDSSKSTIDESSINLIDSAINTTNMSVKHPLNYNLTSNQYCSLLEMLLFFNERILKSEMSDSLRYLKAFYSRLLNLISQSFVCSNQAQAFCLYKLINSGLFIDCAKYLYLHCDEQILTHMISSSKDIKSLVLGYFEYLADIPKNKHQSIARLLSSKISKNEKDRYLLVPIKRLVTRKELLDTVLVYFIPHLTPTEAIVLENMAPISKFKNLLLRKCRVYKSKEEVTVI